MHLTLQMQGPSLFTAGTKNSAHSHCKENTVKLYSVSFPSAGVGRTGALIVLDTQLKRVEDVGTVDVFKNVMNIREHRNLLVQTEV